MTDSEIDIHAIHDITAYVNILLSLNDRGKNMILVNYILGGIKGSISINKVNKFLIILKALSPHLINTQILNIEWLLDNGKTFQIGTFLNWFFGIRGNRINMRKEDLTSEQLGLLIHKYNDFIKVVPELKELKDNYMSAIPRYTSEVLRPSDDPGFYDQGINDLVGSFLFKGRKSKSKGKSLKKSKRRSRGRKSKRRSRGRKSNKKSSRKGKKSR